MKKPMMFALVFALCILLAGGAYAQSEAGAEAKPETQTRTQPDEPVMERSDAGPKGNGTAAATRDRISECQVGSPQALEKVGDQAYGDNDGNNHELGDKNRRGGDFSGETGPHGSMDHGDLPEGLAGDLLKMVEWDIKPGVSIFGENAEGAFAGEILRHSWGPGEAGAGGHFGSSGGVGFGAGVVADNRSESAGAGARRAGRR